MRSDLFRLLAAPTLFISTASAQAFDVNEQFSIGGTLVATGQCQTVSALLPSESYGTELLGDNGDPLLDPVTGVPLLDDSMDAFDNRCSGGLPFQAAAVDYKALYSGGFNLSGNGWGRESDNVGIGYAYLSGGNLSVKSIDRERQSRRY